MVKATLADRINDHSKRIEKAELVLSNMVGNVNKIQAAVNGDGNGSIGMGERLRNMQDDIIQVRELEEKRHKERVEEEADRKATRDKWVYGIGMILIGQVVANVVMLLISAFLWIARIAPVLEKLSAP